jgi:hypothetical protein
MGFSPYIERVQSVPMPNVYADRRPHLEFRSRCSCSSLIMAAICQSVTQGLRRIRAALNIMIVEFMVIHVEAVGFLEFWSSCSSFWLPPLVD